MRVGLLALVMLTLGAAPALAQSADISPAWAASATVITYVVPDEGNYVQPTVALDRKWLHVESRLNYEALNTASLWVGYNLAGGATVAWELTPKVGGAFGDVGGVAPGYAGSIAWWKLDFYSEGEYLLDLTRSRARRWMCWLTDTWVLRGPGVPWAMAGAGPGPRTPGSASATTSRSRPSPLPARPARPMWRARPSPD